MDYEITYSNQKSQRQLLISNETLVMCNKAWNFARSA